MESSTAPGELEQVRTFLNSWWIPNDTRQPVDDLPELVADPVHWARALPAIPPPPRSALASLRALRDQLRGALGVSRPTTLSAVVGSHRWHVELTAEDTEPAIRLQPQRQTTAGALVAIVVGAVAAGQWHRLRACPDCGWVFYDTSRNARRTWCSMTAARGARGCGSIAKTRAYRARRAAGRRA
jgi:predicted RNA-binding Zn ribbon-like protein